jgi:hypothetical protein
VKYRKKPVVVEADQWYPSFGRVPGVCTGGVNCLAPDPVRSRPHVHTAHGRQAVTLEPGDYVIAEPDGRGYYPCKPDTFAATYEPVT